MSMTRKNPHAVALGRRGGLASRGKTSEKKAAASRANGLKGGRPKSIKAIARSILSIMRDIGQSSHGLKGGRPRSPR